MNRSHSFNPIRAVPVAFALIFNIAMGPLGPVVQSQLLGNQTAMAYVGDPSTFELDGNATTQSTHDWDQVYNDRNGPPFSSSGADNLVFTSDTFGAGDDILTGGSTKDINDMSSWLWKQSATTSVQDKDDIENAFAAAYTATNGHSIGVFGLDRYSISGDATAGFWFFKNAIGQAGNGSGNGTGFTGTHAEGDILVVIDFTNGGAQGTATVYKWHSGALTLDTSGTECNNSSQSVCAITNLADASSPWPYTPKSGTANVFPADSKGGAGALYEGGVDLTALGLDTGCFSSFLAETRSSQEPTSTLSDFVLGKFSFCTPPALETQVSSGSVSVGDSVTDDATLTGTKGNIGGSVDFYVCGPTQSAQDCNSTANKVSTETIANPANPVTVTSNAFTASAAGWYCFLAVYNPPAGSKYLTTSHTNDSTECFQAKPAEVHVTKTHDDASVSAGDPIGFTVTVSNAGTGQAKGVTLDDPLPGGNAAHPVHWVIDSSKFDFASFAVNGADGSQSLALSGQPISLGAGDSLKVHITAATTKDNCATYDNSADVHSTNDGSDSASASTAVLCAAIHVTKTADAASVSAGDPIGFVVTLSNTGAGEAKGLSFSDTLPAGTGVSWSLAAPSSGWSISGSAPDQSLVYSGTTLAAGASTSAHIVSDTTKDSCKVYDNTATVSTTNDRSDSASASTAVLCAAIHVTKTADAASVSAGDPIGFVVTLSNTGAGEAKGLSFSDTLPAGTGVSWSLAAPSSGWSISGSAPDQSLVYSGTTLAAGASTSAHIVSDTTKDSCKVYDNTATVSTTNDGSGSASDSTEVLCPVIEVTKVADAGTVSAGTTIGFTVEIKNTGKGDAAGVTLTDALPGGNAATPVHWAIDASEFDSAAFSIGGADGSQALTLVGQPISLAAGGSLKVHITAATSASSCATYDNTASASATNDGSDSASDSAVVECPGLNIAKTAAKSPINGGDSASFTIVVWNAGPGTASNVTLDDPLPGGLTWTDDSDSCTITGANLHCSFGDLGVTTKANSPATVTVTAPTTREDCGTLDNLAAAHADNNPDVTASASIDVVCPTLVIEKAGSVDEVHFVFHADGTLKSVTPANGQVTWTLTYTLNDGPVTNAVISDPLPDFLTFVSADNGGTYDSTTRTVTWHFATLSASGKVSFLTTVDQDAPETGPIVNVASIVSDQTPKDEGQDDVRVTSEQVQAATPSPKPSVPNTATVSGPNGQPIQVPIELLLLFFLGSFGTLTFANVRAVRRRR
jgi:uncharacterized repeat protein (TIGR01451 family)